MKVVGEKSKLFSTASPGTPLQFGGKFKVPILEGIDIDATKRIVLISTGVGVGPCVGAIEKALQSSFPPIDLIASYRTEEEIVYKDHFGGDAVDEIERVEWLLVGRRRKKAKRTLLSVEVVSCLQDS